MQHTVVWIVFVFYSLAAAQINLSTIGTATQSSTYKNNHNYAARLAVTGGPTNDFNSGSCSHTGTDQQAAWWMLALSNNSLFVEQVNIFYRSGSSKRLDGYSLYLSNTGISGLQKQTPPGYLCYKDTLDGTASINQTVACNHMGQFVILYNDNKVSGDSAPFLELCDVQVFGCSKERFGPQCSKLCSPKCFDQHCYPSNGSCVFGCNCLGDFCDESELCTGGCKDGFIGQYCNEACWSPNFGQKCNYTCHCKNQQIGCNNVDGTCPAGGCQKGWTGTSCSTECSLSTFGENCAHTCHCENTQAGCNNSDGTCPEGGCQKGWQGKNCSIECKLGQYGFNCSKYCDGCLSTSCNKTTGKCTNTTQCNSGWAAEPPFCKTVCPFPTFGESCSHSCHCRNQSLGCNHVDGICHVEGCAKGWYGENCSTACIDGTFGFDCRGNCSHCLNNTCEKTNGDCKYGCVEGYNDGSCFKIAQQDQEDKVDSTGTIAGVGVAAVAIIIIAVIIIIFFLRRRTNKADSGNNFSSIQRHNLSSRGKTKRTKYSDENNYVNVQPGASPNDDKVPIQKLDEGTLNILYQNDDDSNDDKVVYNNVNVDEKYTDHNIAIEDLARCINEKLADNGFETEYESLPKGHVYPHTEGTKEKNKLKNRFLTTWPYDHSRVVLKGDKSSDYINASYIDNYIKEKAYIATQGPKNNSIKDFWQMIWQEDVKVIVMVTQLKESGREKCRQYWPELQDKCMSIGHFEISVCKETIRTIYVKRVFTLHNKKDNNGRTIHQFHFTQWPDHGVPDIIKLVDFYRKVKEESDHYDVPMVVHCSAGIGRTGTFLAIDALYEHGQRTGFINVMEYAQMMRKDRMNMIQTKDQYQTVFEALLELFTVPDTSLAREDYSKETEKEQTQHVPKNQTKLYLEFQRLKTLKPVYSESSYSTANTDENRVKNGNSILPHDKYRPILMSTEKDRNNYINAVILPEYSSKNKTIVTQYPLKDTVVDFWTLIYDHQCSVVVMLGKPSSETPLWSNTDTPLNFRMFTIQTVKEGSEVNIKLTNKTNRETRQVSVYLMDEWTCDDLPASSSSILDLISNVSQKRESNMASLAVVDRDGASRSGLFVALTLILQKLQMDDEVDIFQVVRMMQVRRPEFLTNVGQYEYCNQCVKEYLDRDSLYANT